MFSRVLRNRNIMTILPNIDKSINTTIFANINITNTIVQNNILTIISNIYSTAFLIDCYITATITDKHRLTVGSNRNKFATLTNRTASRLNMHITHFLGRCDHHNIITNNCYIFLNNIEQTANTATNLFYTINPITTLCCFPIR